MILHIFLGGLAGFLAGKLMRGQGYGVIIDILLGCIGGWALSLLGLHIPIWSYFITAFLGAVLLVWIVRGIKGN